MIFSFHPKGPETAFDEGGRKVHDTIAGRRLGYTAEAVQSIAALPGGGQKAAICEVNSARSGFGASRDLHIPRSRVAGRKFPTRYSSHIGRFCPPTRKKLSAPYSAPGEGRETRRGVHQTSTPDAHRLAKKVRKVLNEGHRVRTLELDEREGKGAPRTVGLSEPGRARLVSKVPSKRNREEGKKKEGRQRSIPPNRRHRCAGAL